MPRDLCKQDALTLRVCGGGGDHIYLRVSPMKGMKRFGMKGKLAPHYIGPFPILKKGGTVAYKLDVPPSIAGVHDIFHV
jgi:hypothetical protein